MSRVCKIVDVSKNDVKNILDKPALKTINRTSVKTTKTTTKISTKTTKVSTKKTPVYNIPNIDNPNIELTNDLDDPWADLFKQINDPIIIDTQDNLEHIYTTMTTKPSQSFIDLDNDFSVIKPAIDKSPMVCKTCNIDLVTYRNVLICNQCGLEIADTAGATDEQYSSSISSDCNVNDKGFMSMKIVGKGGYGNNRSLLRSCAQYGQYRKMNTLKDMHNWNSQSTGKHVPKNVIEEACAMFAKIKDKGKVYRKDVKKGVLSACIYYACYNNGISKTPNEIATIMGIQEKFHSAGDRILRDLNERGIIALPDKIDPIIDYVERYMEILNIPKFHKQFVLDIIHVADKEKLHVLSDSKNNTKCIGAIYLLIDRVAELRKTVDRDKIDKECEISKTTFLKYYNLICKFYRKFVPVFVRHRVPMKREWIEDKSDGLNAKPNKTPKVAPSRAKALAESKRLKALALTKIEEENEVDNEEIKLIIDTNIRTKSKPKTKLVKTKLKQESTLTEHKEPTVITKKIVSKTYVNRTRPMAKLKLIIKK
jgi:transcription initiation factor TFIIIB Brf1 subunit/transcription initiation factor TFIIB